MATRTPSRPELPVDERTLPRVLALRAERAADGAFLAFGDAPAITFGAMDVRTARLANALAACGVGFGDRVALLLPNCADLVATWFAAARLGAIEVPLNPELRGPLLAHALGDAAPRVVVCDGRRLEALAAVSREVALQVVVVRGSSVADAQAAGVRCERIVAFAELEQHGDDSTPAAAVQPRDPVAILYTSGTTGPAKGVVMPHLQYWSWVEAMVRNLGLTAEDSYYTPLPLFHADAQLFGVYFPLVYGTRGTIDERFSASRYWSRVTAAGATATNMLGAMAHILWKAPPRPGDRDNPIRVCQALPMVQFREPFQERFGLALATAYGQTETSFVTMDSPSHFRAGSCGRPAPGYTVQVVDAHDQPVAPGRVGEIVVRHEHPFTIALGYHGMPERTLLQTRNLWWHSGDRGHFDADGWLYFDGRMNDAIRRRGENISADELESIVDRHPAVLESAAVGVPSEVSEDDILVVVAVQEGHALSEREIVDFCVASVPRHMVPRYVELCAGPLPRTPTEKIARSALRARGVTATTWDRERDARAR